MKLRSIEFLLFAASTACVLVTSAAQAAPPSRISSQLVDLGEVHKVYLAQGLASIIQLPYPVTEAKVGSPDDWQVQISKTLPSELTVLLKRANAQVTNLIARCGSRTFVFDLIPSRKTHQDLVRISGSYGTPNMADMGAVLIDSSRPVQNTPIGNRSEDAEMVLIDSSLKGLLSDGTAADPQKRGGK